MGQIFVRDAEREVFCKQMSLKNNFIKRSFQETSLKLMNNQLKLFSYMKTNEIGLLNGRL
jgi:hypothetical protein